MVENGVNGFAKASPTVNGGDTLTASSIKAKPAAPSQLELERRLLDQLSPQALSSKRAPSAVGEVWSLVAARWMRAWRRFVNARSASGIDNEGCGAMDEYADEHPGPIDNSSILLATDSTNTCPTTISSSISSSSTGRLRAHLLDGADYSRLAPEAWQQLLGWYGLAPGQSAVLRPARQLGRLARRIDIEPYPLRLRLAAWDRPADQSVREFSRTDSLADVKAEARRVLLAGQSLESRLCRLWLYDDAGVGGGGGGGGSPAYRQLPSSADQMQRLDQLVFDDQCLLLEVQDANGSWPKGKAAESSALASIPPPPPLPPPPPPPSATQSQQQQQKNSLQKQEKQHQQQLPSSPHLPGVCGLVNLCNSCFMNSALQALSNVHLLTNYFLSNKWQAELNRDNPLGMRGEIATCYGQLISDIWSGRHASLAPRQFKQTLGRFAPQFSGFQQHDSQELMAFLLDGLHEDLNRVRAKPYVEVKDANGRPDEAVAKEAWLGYKQRNDSIIVDLFHGQLKSTLVCPDPDCAKVSVTFDPFCYLSLPLPKDRSRLIVYNFVRLDPSLPILRAKLTLPAEGRIAQLCSEIARQMNLMNSSASDCLLVTDVFKNRFYKVFSPNDYYSDIDCDRDEIFVYELDAPVSSTRHIVVKVIFTTSERLENRFGLPLVFSAPLDGLIYGRLVDLVKLKAARLLSVRDKNGQIPIWWDKADEDESTNQPPPLFVLRGTNSNLSTEVPLSESLFSPDTPKPRELYLAAKFTIKAKQTCCNEAAALRTEKHPSLLASGANGQPRRTLTDCLKLFTTEEQLDKKDAWHCPKCKKFQRATKKFDIWTLPKVLVVHLKRFQFDRICRTKIDQLVEFPLRGLDMAPWAINHQPSGAPATYNLVSVANHFGGLGGGHYTAYGLNSLDQRWYEFDDSQVLPVANQNSIVSSAAYLLVYVRSDLMPSAGSPNLLAASQAEVDSDLDEDTDNDGSECDASSEGGEDSESPDGDEEEEDLMGVS